MKILFVGLFYNPDEESKLLDISRNGLPIASNLYQWNLIKGIDCVMPLSMDIVGSLPLGNYPNLSSKLLFPSQNKFYKIYSYKEIGMIDFYWIKHKQREWKIFQYIKVWKKKYASEKLFIFFYDLHLEFLNIIVKMKKLDWEIKSILVVPDLAGKYRNDQGYKGLKKIYLNRIATDVFKRAENADGYILLTEEMNKVINHYKKPYIVVDGIIDENRMIPQKENKKGNTIFMYAGALMKQYNVSFLIEAFESINDLSNIELWFCGKGDAVDLIKDACEKNTKIKYLGFVGKKKLKEIERQISVYINPRTNVGIYTKYSFPSKNLEYMLSGKPVIGYKLDGMSDDYDNVMIYVKDNNIESLAEIMKDLAVKSDKELDKMGEKAREFVIEHNSSLVQGKRIIKFLMKIE
jgi:glycosyltransferase involved in cell wall biosynthesis